MSGRIISIIILVAFLFSASEGFAVDRLVPSMYPTIQAAIDAAFPGDTVIVEPDEYYETIDFLGKNITVTSTNPSDPNIVINTTIEGSSDPYFKAVIFGGTENASCTLTGFNIREKVIGYHTHATMSHCLLEGTRSPCGNIILHFDGKISNCLIGPAMLMAQCFLPSETLQGCHGTIENCTIIGTATIGAGGSATVENSIFYSDVLYEPIIKLFSGASLDISYSDLYESIDPIEEEDSNCVVNWGPGNIELDPCFVALGTWDFNDPITYYPGDFHLMGYTSPCFNTGDPNYVAGPNETDIDGDERVINGRVDMGADEVEIECMAKTNPAYDNWVYWDKPDCWCYAKQCRGDADGLTFAGVFPVSGIDLAILKGALNRLEALMPEGGECADLDHKKFSNIFWVSGQDLYIMKNYISKIEVMIPECGDPPDPNYNFWLTP